MPKHTVAALCICSTCLLAWFGVAFISGQSPIDTQTSKLLMQLGAVNGSALESHEYWKLVSSQFLHSKFPHMLFNVLVAGLFCVTLEAQIGWLRTIFLYLASGTAGQIASVLAYPELVSSGASQAVCGIATAALVLSRSKLTMSVALAYLAVAVLLDMLFAGYLKTGHIFGAISGGILGFFILQTQSTRVEA